MDSTDWERIVARIRAESDRIQRIRHQWASLQRTPEWSGPSEQAAWTQVHDAAMALRDISQSLAEALDSTERELAAAKRREETQALV